MHTRALIGAAGLAGATILIGQMTVDAVPDNDPGLDFISNTVPMGEAGNCQWQDPPSTGPDVIPGDMQSTRWWARSGGETAYTFGTTSCNIGDQTLDWAGNPNHNHPVISQNMFRLDKRPGHSRFMQIGQAWLKHSFCALQQGICGSCNGGGGCQNVLHPCCSDPYTATRNGSQGGLGPKWQVNAHTGEFVLPWATGEGTSGNFRRRIRVKDSELAWGLESNYYIEGMYVAKDDALAGNQNNNASYRRVIVGLESQNYPLSFSGGTVRSKAAIQAWTTLGTAQTASVQIDSDGLRDGNNRYEDGLFIVGWDVIDNGDGTWKYEYAVQNMSSHRSGSSFTVAVPNGVDVTGMGFHDVDYHSGDGPGNQNYDGTDWIINRNAADVTWQVATSNGVNDNALRWGTLYNFWFVADSGPTRGDSTIGLYRPDEDHPDYNSETTSVDVPSPVVVDCPEDLDGSGSADFGDILAVLAAWGNAGGVEDLDNSGTVDFGDILAILAAWGPCE